jgi:hypothetical protein
MEASSSDDGSISHMEASSSDDSSISDDSDSSDDSVINICTVMLVLSEREMKVHRLRVAWDHHATILRHEKQFESKYRMSYESFMKLAKLLEPSLIQSDRQSLNSCGQLAVCPPHILGLTIRWHSAGCYHDIRDAGNFSVPTFFRLLKKGIRAISSCRELALKLPTKLDELEELAEGFKFKSTEGIMFGCVGALDGLLLLIRTPKKDEAANVRQFFSGHYQRMGLNVQGLVDCHLRFLYAGVLAGGRASDYKAYQKSSILHWIENLPPMYFVAGDNAYVCTEHLLTPFCGSNRSIPENDAYNFYLSQLRIRVEMAFGLLKTKWRILRTALEVPLAEAPVIFQVCCLLHNYCINERLQLDEEIRIERMYGEDNTHQLGYIPSDTVSLPHSGSVLRNRIVQRISNNSLSRPELNVQRRNLEEARKAMYFDVE